MRLDSSQICPIALQPLPEPRTKSSSAQFSLQKSGSASGEGNTNTLKKQADDELAQKAQAFLQLYIETYGAPEEKNQVITSRVGEKEEDKKDKKKGTDDEVAEVLSKVLQNPEDPKKMEIITYRYEQDKKAEADEGGEQNGLQRGNDSQADNKKKISRRITLNDWSGPDLLAQARRRGMQVYNNEMQQNQYRESTYGGYSFADSGSFGKQPEQR